MSFHKMDRAGIDNQITTNKQAQVHLYHLYELSMQLHIIECNVVHNTAQNSSDNLFSYPPDNHHRSDNYVCWRGRAIMPYNKYAN